MKLLDWFRKKQTQKPPDLVSLSLEDTNRLQATYDAARDSPDFDNYWANVDGLDADSANNRSVRQKLVYRSRYEIGNNGYANGIASTYATDLVGVGPKLRMETGSTGFNQMVELEWYRWHKAILFRDKLNTMALAKITDGESFGVARTNRKVKHPVLLDVMLYETEQCTSPTLGLTLQPGYIDGIKFDSWGNPEWYDILPQHPGSQFNFFLTNATLIPEKVPAEYVLHWYMRTRPGQHRGIPELTSTLNVGASSRRFREATVAAAESAADIAALLKTGFAPDQVQQLAPMTTVNFEKRMLTALPAGWDAVQMKGEHPNATYEAFIRSQISEIARPKSMPYNKAACDSSSYNYASGRLDHQTYYAALDVDRESANDKVLDPLFELWFNEAVRVFGWLGGNPNALSPQARSHSWDWPKHPVADVQTEATATDSRLKNGSLSLSQLYSQNGEDFEDELPRLASDYGVSTDEMRRILLNSVFNAQNQQASMATAEQQQQQPSNPIPAETPAK